MTDTARLLPEGYEALEPFVADWAIPTLAGRVKKRIDSSPEEKHSLYEVVRELAPQALGELDAKPLDQFNVAERRLLAVLLSYAQVALSIEVRGEGEPVHAQDRRHMIVTREPAGFPCFVPPDAP